MRLDKVLEQAQLGSKKVVKRLLVSRQVTVDGQVITRGSTNVDPGLQEVCVKGNKLKGQGHRYVMLNKPQGVVSAVTDKEHQTVIGLLGEDQKRTSLFPVGRLDRDTEGLLLITDNGKLAYQLAMATKKVVKRYEVRVNAEVTTYDQELVKHGIIFDDGYQCLPASLRILHSNSQESHLLLDITEGKFHQIKKMFLAMGKKVTYLKRLSMGPLVLDKQLAPGQWRELTPTELEKLLVYFNEHDGMAKIPEEYFNDFYIEL
ncbi:pseudouridine synthase [Vagococcus intermedius]|uniref:Pseudouridine synthase n=1 Tax=Vagococcus intermedius TaxID=2991418 RepID=A0AAF0I7R7_9ENTE|nr:pseudouridine synthase [Vagococcus intermedius]WEG73231.1 rRNA pseudouridine synthase [Vagococcus intermedius]WEG75316.1 rRNA pseudouridine synthase [Vagococcus intermedius]